MLKKDIVTWRCWGYQTARAPCNCWIWPVFGFHDALSPDFQSGRCMLRVTMNSFDPDPLDKRDNCRCHLRVVRQRLLSIRSPKCKPALSMAMGELCQRPELSEWFQGTDALYRWALVFFLLAGIWSKVSMCPRGFRKLAFRIWFRLAIRACFIFSLMCQHCFRSCVKWIQRITSTAAH